jgi:phosphoribosylpyrophosphate synthetase
MNKNIFIINGSNSPINKNLLKKLLKELNIHNDNLFFLHDEAEIKAFNNGETRIKLISDKENFSFQDCDKFIVVQSLTENKFINRVVDSVFFETECIINACRNLNKNAEIVLIATNFGYSRQDRAINSAKFIDKKKYEVSEPLALQMRIQNLKNAGLTKIVTFDPHSTILSKYCDENQIEHNMIEKEELLEIFGEIFEEILFSQLIDESQIESIKVFFHLFCGTHTDKEIEFIENNSSELALAIITEFFIKKLVLVAPDHGCAEKVKILWHSIKSHLLAIFMMYGKQTSSFINLLSEFEGRIIFIKKSRPEPGKSEITEIVGPRIDNKICLIVDDILDTGGTLCNSAKALKENYGASDIYCFTTHGVLSNNAVERMNKSNFTKIFITNTETSAKLKIDDFYLKNSEEKNKFNIKIIDNTLVREIINEISN